MISHWSDCRRHINSVISGSNLQCIALSLWAQHNIGSCHCDDKDEENSRKVCANLVQAGVSLPREGSALSRVGEFLSNPFTPPAQLYPIIIIDRFNDKRVSLSDRPNQRRKGWARANIWYFAFEPGVRNSVHQKKESQRITIPERERSDMKNIAESGDCRRAESGLNAWVA